MDEFYTQFHDIEKEMSAYLKDLKEGSSLASLGTDH